MDKIANLTDETTNPFAGMPIISCYTWDDAVRDGTFVEVTGLAKSWGFKIPVALTRSVYSLCETNGERVDNNISRLLIHLFEEIKKQTESDSMLCFKHKFNAEEAIDVWATMEGRSPENPEPVMTIMLPSDY